jgi:hypothetical protein
MQQNGLTPRPISKWRYRCEDNSISTTLLKGYWLWVVKFVPGTALLQFLDCRVTRAVCSVCGTKRAVAGRVSTVILCSDCAL